MLDSTTIDISQATGAVTPAKARRISEEERRMTEWLDTRIAASKKAPSAEVVTLTPILAGLLLQRNPINRPINKRNAADLQQDIANGRFSFNGESIIISNTGVLNDGQHRCRTVVETGISIPTVIVFGPKEETRFTVDTGRNKSASNFLAMKGRLYSHALAAAVTYMLQYKTAGTLIYGERPTKAAILAAADEFRGIDASIEFTHPSMSTVRSHAVIAFCHYVFWKKTSREIAGEFILRLIDGDNLKKGDPIFFYRNRMLSLGRGSTARDRTELIFKCFNAWRTGSTISLFRVSGGKLPKIER